MARVKKVFSSQPGVIRRWIDQVQEFGECKAFGRRSMFFVGKDIYSDFPKDRDQWEGPKFMLATFESPEVALVNADATSYTATGAYHRRHVRRLLNSTRGMKYFDVPSVVMSARPVEILQALVKRHEVSMGLAKRSRGRLVARVRIMEACAQQATDYAQIHQLPPPDLAFTPGVEIRLHYRMAKAMVLERKMRAERGW